MNMFCVIVLCVLNIVLTQDNYFVDITIKQGIIRGLRIRSAQNREGFAFLGIPYATPPYDRLRFKAPVPHPGWSGVLDTTNFRPMCPQLDSRGSQLGDEDCLFLNVYTPGVVRNRKPNSQSLQLPVMVYIQAESFENGDSALYGGEYLMDKDVVVVTFNYRVGILGFLSTEDEAASGNWGLFDQKLVLEWVRDNIASFNGDPNLVTIFGQGSGAASVIYHIISPLTQGLFHRAIAQSGSALCQWALERSPLMFAREVAKSVDCPVTSNTNLVNCLRKTHYSLLLNAQSKAKTFGEFPHRSAPVVERTGTKRFIPDEPTILLNSGNFQKVPLIMGLNSDETAFFYPLLANNRNLRTDPMSLEKIVLPQFLESTTRLKGPKQRTVVQTVLFKYFNRVDLINISDISHRFINMSSDALYTSCIDQTLKLYSKVPETPVYMYLFAYKGANSLVNILVDNSKTMFETGVCHGDELFYLFDLKMSSQRWTFSKDMQIRERLLTLWTDFAKHGYSPQFANYEFPRWLPYDSQKLNYYRIGNDLRPESGYRQSETHFWNNHLPTLIGVSPIVQPLSNKGRPYATLAYTMVAVSITLLLLIAILLAILYYQRKRQSFSAQPQEGSAISSGSSFLY
ncbi:cholinesterase 2-like [Oppia nitens]|uniref:cholinesterase 2-like n=1 Tax=Oppia nitens TaxID=1686743 RepID=UPI0023DB71BE|nr:cholinesterase 2-like [Oppia nitens]